MDQKPSARILILMATKPDDNYLANLTSSYSPIYGQAISIRPMRPGDLEIETEFVENWSAETRYNRLFSAGSHTSPERLKQQWKEIAKLERTHSEIRLLKSMEVDIVRSRGRK